MEMEMKKNKTTLGVLSLLLVSCLLVSSASAAWQMQWNDEFNGNSLDPSKWDIEVNCWGGGNGEKQCYTNRAENIFVSNGALNLRPVAGTYQGSNNGCTLNNENSCTWTQPSTSGRVRTLRAVDGSWKYGRFEIRAKLPKGNWLWPAIWMLPTDNVYGIWAASGEIDIMEARGQVPNQASSAVHFGGQWPNNAYTTGGDINYNFDFTNDFHVFALEWDANNLKFFVDDRLAWTQTLQRSFGNYGKNGAPFDQRFHILLNVAVAGGFFDPNRFGTFNIGSAAPTWTQPMQIDFVRVFKWVDGPVPVPIAPPPVQAPVRAPVQAPVQAPIQPTPSPTPTPGQCSILQFPLFPVDDAHSDALRPTMSFGSDKTLSLRGSADAKQSRTAYVKFYLPRDRIPSRAIFSLWGSLEEESGAMNVIVSGPLSNEWNDNGLTHNERPSSCSSCPSATQPLGLAPTWTTWDVLPIIRKAIQDGSDVVTLSIRLTSNGHASFNSAESSTNKPILNLAY